MKVRSCILYFFLIAPLLAFSSPQANYLQLNAIHNDQLLSTIIGNGLEKGVAFHLFLWEENLEHLQYPKFTIPPANNLADCHIENITAKFSTAVGPQIGAGWVDFQVEMKTSVGGDSGGCLLLAYRHQGPGAEIVKIISYEYQTH